MDYAVLGIERKAERVRRLAAGLCAVCGKSPLDGVYMCTGCKEKSTLYARERRAKKRAEFVEANGVDGRTLRAVERRARTEIHCRTCAKTKAVDEFSFHDTKTGCRKTICKTCDAERAVRWAKAHPNERAVVERRRHLKRTFGLTETDYEEMLTSQGGACKICKRKSSGTRNHRMFVDHDHTTEKVRGLLCFKCNTGIGAFDDNPGLLEKAAAYIEEYAGVTK